MKETTEPKYIVRATRLSVLPPNEPLFSEQCTDISIVNEGVGEFVSIQQDGEEVKAGELIIRIDPEEWPVLKDAITTMVNACKRDVK